MSVILSPKTASSDFAVIRERESSERAANRRDPVCASVLETARRGESPHDGENRKIKGALFTESALSNYLVLRTIFLCLPNHDLESCCEVNKFWNSIVDPLLVRYYDVKMKRWSDMNIPAFGQKHVYPIVIRKLPSDNNMEVIDFECNLEDASKFFEAATQTEKIAINLNIICYHHLKISWYDDSNESLTSFFSEFGSLVAKLRIEGYFTAGKFCHPIVRYFPNLKHLDLSVASSEANDEDFDENLLQNPLKHLKSIIFGRGDIFDQESLTNLFKMAPNLEEFHDFPVVLVDALIDTRKSGCIKSLWYPRNSTETEFCSSLQKLANLEPKLLAFTFDCSDLWPEESLCSAIYRPVVHRILQSSHDSLTSLTLYKTESFDFNSISPMTYLKEIIFKVQNYSEDDTTRFFPPDIQLQRLFPNVIVVSIPTHPPLNPALDLVENFPENQFIPWGLQMQTLKVLDVSVNMIQQLSRIFSHIKSLDFRVGVRGHDLQRVLGEVGKNLPRVECLTVIVSHFSCGCVQGVEDCQELTLDSVFTGIPDHILAKLKGKSRKSVFHSEEMESFKEASVIRKLKNLKVLKFNLGCNRSDFKFLDKLSAVSSMSKEFGFRFLPDLAISVRTRRDDRNPHVMNMKSSLKKFVNLQVERFD